MKYLTRLLLLLTPSIYFSCNDRAVKVNEDYMAETIPKNSICKYKLKSQYFRNDVVVVKYLNRIFDKEFVSVLRVVGIPGDKIEIKNGSVFINDKEHELPQSAVLAYRLRFKEKGDSIGIINGYNLQKAYLPNSWFLTMQTFSSLKKSNKIDSIERVFFPQSLQQNATIGSNSFSWNMDNFGPLRISSRNEAVAAVDRQFYYDLPTSESTINDDYYFLIGDNFYQSMDSRIIGLLPKKNILGEVKKTRIKEDKKEVMVEKD